MFSAKDVEDLDLSHLSIDDFLPDFEDDLSEDGLGATKRKRRRKTKKAKKARKPRRKARKAKAKSKRKPRRKTRRKPSKAKARRKPRRKSRRKARRVAGLSNAGLANAIASGLGKAKKSRRKKRKSTKKAKSSKARKPRKARKAKARRKPRRKARRKARKMQGLGSLSNAVGRLSLSEVKKSKPIIGGLQWLASKPGLESVGGGAGGALTLGLVDGVVMPKLDPNGKMPPMLRKVLSTLVASIGMWELGKLMKSGMAAKLGLLYPVIKLLDDELVQPQIIDRIRGAMGMSGLGQMRVPDAASFGQVRIPESTELVGLNQVRLPEDSEEGFEDVMAEEDLGQNFEADEAIEENVF